jgi:hypothetical protein
MSLCYSLKKRSSSLKKEKIIIVDSTLVNCNIDKNKLNTIMVSILSKYCNIKIYGYNKTNEQYWCKNVKEKTCSLFMNIEIYSYNYNKTIVILTPITGESNEIISFIEKFKEGIQLYQGDAFVRQYLD